jgi:hypothetical protein
MPNRPESLTIHCWPSRIKLAIHLTMMNTTTQGGSVSCGAHLVQKGKLCELSFPEKTSIWKQLFIFMIAVSLWLQTAFFEKSEFSAQ